MVLSLDAWFLMDQAWVKQDTQGSKEMDMRKVADIEICEDCLIVVDGDPSMGSEDDQARTTVAGVALAQNWPGMHVHGATNEEGESSFSWAGCDGCGSQLGGSRYPAVVLADD
jgi:hypothetical protein